MIGIPMIHPIKNWISIGAILLISGFASAAYGQSKELKWKLKAGDQFAVVLVQKSNSETKVDTRETTVASETTIGMDWEVKNVNSNGDATISQSLTSVKLSVTGFTRKKKGETASPLMEVNFDTSAPDGITSESKNLMQQVQPLLGLNFEVVMSPQGEIIDVQTPENVAKQLAQMPDTQKLRALFSKDGLKDILGASAIVVPKNLTPGQSWTEKTETTTALGSFNRNRTYTYIETKPVDGKQVAEFSLNVTLDPIDESDSQAAATALDSKLIEFTGSGVLLMDVDGGFFHSSKIENRAHSEKPYREKMVDTVVTNQIEMTVNRK